MAQNIFHMRHNTKRGQRVLFLILVTALLYGCNENSQPQPTNPVAKKTEVANDDSCIEPKGKNLFSDFKGGCLGPDCTEPRDCGDIKLIFKKGGKFYAEYSCHGPVYNGTWFVKNGNLIATTVSSESRADYCSDQCHDEDLPCLKKCKATFFEKFGKNELKTRLRYEFVDRGFNHIELQLITTDLHPVEGKEKYDNSWAEPEWEEMGCMH